MLYLRFSLVIIVKIQRHGHVSDEIAGLKVNATVNTVADITIVSQKI